MTTTTEPRKWKCAACDHVIEQVERPVVCPNCRLDAREVIIAPRKPDVVRDFEGCCARCGSDIEWIRCDRCDGAGETEPGELYEEDPLWYDEDDVEPCHQCGGVATRPVCLSSAEWCEANPKAGREKVKRGAFEWTEAPVEDVA